MKVCLFIPARGLTWRSPVIAYGVIGIPAALLVEDPLVVSAALSEFIFLRLGLLSFQLEIFCFLNSAELALSLLCKVHLFSIHPKPFLQLSEPHRQIYTVRLLR